MTVRRGIQAILRVSALLALALAVPGPARAADPLESAGGDLQRLQPASTPLGGFATPSSDVLPVSGWAVGMLLDYARNPLVLLRNGERVASTVQNNLTAHVQGAFGLREWLELGAGVSLVPFQSGNDARFPGLPAFAIGDLRLLPKFVLLSQWKDGLNLSITPALTVPLGGSDALAGDSFLTFTPELAVSRRTRARFFAASALFRLRREVQLFSGAELGREIGIRLAGGQKLTQDTEAILELDGGLALANPGSLTSQSLEARAGVRWRPSDRWAFDAGVGAGLFSAVGTPDFRAILGATYGSGLLPRPTGACQRVASEGLVSVRESGFDTDADGFDDACDRCPSDAEPAGHAADADGCPERDRDHDRILDAADQCPDVPGLAPSGCPDADADGLFDAVDQCPQVLGDAPSGCPDTDFDGVLDRDDQCIVDPGEKPSGCPDADLDGLFDADDQCPEVAGDAPTGCPDSDQDGLLDAADQCPKEPEDKDLFEDADGCPDPDNDHDGLLDAADQCPLDPEDRDGFEDENGCPDPDNDKDGILDAADKCPSEPETINGVTDEDGCPDKGQTLVVIRANKIEILDKVYFDTSKAVIQKRSFGLLKQVALIVKAHPELTRIRVEGHTDDIGNDAANLDLSQRRAASVVRFLGQEGVDVARLTPRGYGETSPIKPNLTPASRAANRRVEFTILADGDGGETP